MNLFFNFFLFVTIARLLPRFTYHSTFTNFWILIYLFFKLFPLKMLCKHKRMHLLIPAEICRPRVSQHYFKGTVSSVQCVLWYTLKWQSIVQYVVHSNFVPGEVHVLLGDAQKKKLNTSIWSLKVTDSKSNPAMHATCTSRPNFSCLSNIDLSQHAQIAIPS